MTTGGGNDRGPKLISARSVGYTQLQSYLLWRESSLRTIHPPQRNTKRKRELCKTLLPGMDSSTSPPPSERGPFQDTPRVQPTESEFRATYHIQNTKPYENFSEVRNTGCMVCGRSVESLVVQSSLVYGAVQS